MLKKLLRYDLKSIFKYWWIVAIASFALSIVGGSSMSIITAEQDGPLFIDILIVFSLIFTFIGIVAFPIISFILTYVRFYKNFFTDEGYLTFTLPVKRSQLLNSKLISSVLIFLASTVVIITDIFVFLSIGVGDDFYNDVILTISRDLPTLFKGFTLLDYTYLSLIIIAIITLIVLGTVFTTLFVFACITFAAIITKKAKVITAIGVYYLANGAISGFMQIVYLFGITAIIDRLAELPKNSVIPIVVLMFYIAVAIMILLCLLLYTLNYFMLDRKLNLA